MIKPMQILTVFDRRLNYTQTSPSFRKCWKFYHTNKALKLLKTLLRKKNVATKWFYTLIICSLINNFMSIRIIDHQIEKYFYSYLLN